MDCHELDDLTHAVLAVVSSAYNPKTGKSKWTPTHVRQELGFKKWQEVREILTDLEENKFLEMSSQGHIVLTFPCKCDPRKIFEASRTHAGTGNGYWGLPLHGSPRNHPASHPPLGNSGYHTTPTTPKEQTFFGEEEKSKNFESDDNHAVGESPPTLQGRRVDKLDELDKSPPEQWSTMGFARYFSREIKNLAGKANFIPVTPKQKMARQFSLWFSEGMDRRTVKLMIDEFCGDPKWMRKNLGVRQSFFYSKDRLLQEVLRKQQRAKRQEYGDGSAYGW